MRLWSGMLCFFQIDAEKTASAVRSNAHAESSMIPVYFSFSARFSRQCESPSACDRSAFARSQAKIPVILTGTASALQPQPLAPVGAAHHAFPPAAIVEEPAHGLAQARVEIVARRP